MANVSASLQINNEGMATLDKILKARLDKGTEKAVEIIKDNVRVDTQRMKDSTRAASPLVKPGQVKSQILVGGTSQRGVLREADEVKAVDYALAVEIKYGDIRRQLPKIVNAVVEAL